MLAGAGAIVTSAKDGREAVALAERTAFNVIVTDIQMPHLDGFGEAKQIRKIEQQLMNTPNERIPGSINKYSSIAFFIILSCQKKGYPVIYFYIKDIIYCSFFYIVIFPTLPNFF